MLRPLRPTHFGDVHETFHARFKLNECAVVGHARNRAFDARADDETFLDTLPRIGQQLFVAERDALAVPIKF